MFGGGVVVTQAAAVGVELYATGGFVYALDGDELEVASIAVVGHGAKAAGVAVGHDVSTLRLQDEQRIPSDQRQERREAKARGGGQRQRTIAAPRVGAQRGIAVDYGVSTSHHLFAVAASAQRRARTGDWRARRDRRHRGATRRPKQAAKAQRPCRDCEGSTVHRPSRLEQLLERIQTVIIQSFRRLQGNVLSVVRGLGGGQSSVCPEPARLRCFTHIALGLRCCDDTYVCTPSFLQRRCTIE